MFPILRLLTRSAMPSQAVKTYVSTAYENSLVLPARIRYQHNAVHLQILSSSQIGKELQAQSSLRERILGTAWYTLLKINKKQGMTYEEAYHAPVANEHTVSFIPPEHIIFPEKIFSVPQIIWEEFIHHLDNQEVVGLLNLKQHRHLWAAYQYAVSAPTASLMNSRANVIGEFHFLLSFALYQPTVITQQLPNHQKESRLPLVSVIKNDLEHGKFDLKKMVKLHDCFSLLVVKKLRHCTNILDLSLVACMISSFAKISLEPMDLKRKSGASSLLPSSCKEPQRFESALKLAKTLQKISSRPGLLFFNSQSQWANYQDKTTNLDSLGKHYLDALFHDLVLRQILLQAHRAYEGITSGLLHTIKEHFESIFLQDTAINNFEIKCTYWQRNSHHLAALKPSRSTRQFWSPLVGRLEMKGITITPLASAETVLRHGQMMKHCVQETAFIDCCRGLNADILELMSEDGEISTLDIRPTYQGGYYILQHVGVGGTTEPSERHVEVGRQFIQDLKEGHIQISKARQMEHDNIGVNIYQFDYELNDMNTQERIYQEYKSKKMLPHRLIFADYSKMLQVTGLANKIDEIIKNINDLSCLDGAQHKP